MMPQVTQVNSSVEIGTTIMSLHNEERQEVKKKHSVSYGSKGKASHGKKKARGKQVPSKKEVENLLKQIRRNLKNGTGILELARAMNEKERIFFRQTGIDPRLASKDCPIL